MFRMRLAQTRDAFRVVIPGMCGTAFGGETLWRCAAAQSKVPSAATPWGPGMAGPAASDLPPDAFADAIRMPAVNHA